MRVSKFEDTFAGEQHAMSGVARRNHAVEQIDSGCDGVDEVGRVTDSHQVARCGRGEHFVGRCNEVGPLGRFFAEPQPAVRVSLEAERGDALRVGAANRGVGAALNDAK